MGQNDIPSLVQNWQLICGGVNIRRQGGANEMQAVSRISHPTSVIPHHPTSLISHPPTTSDAPACIYSPHNSYHFSLVLTKL